MRNSDLRKLFYNQLASSDFKKIINNEVNDYKGKIQKRGSSIQIILIEDEDVILDMNSILILCQLFTKEIFSVFEFCYILDAISMSSKIYCINEQVDIILNQLLDFENTGDYTKSAIDGILNSHL